MTGGACLWDDHEHRWGVVLEFTFDDERARDAFRDSPLLRTALDGAPDKVLVHPHRGGGDGIRQPRRPRPLLRSGGPRSRCPTRTPTGSARARRPHPRRATRRQLVRNPPSTGSVVPVT